MTVFEWLNCPAKKDGSGPTVLERLAELICVEREGSGCFSYGVIASGGTYGRRGLNRDEAEQLSDFLGILAGFSLSRRSVVDGKVSTEDPDGAEVVRLVEAEIERAKQSLRHLEVIDGQGASWPKIATQEDAK